MVPWRFFIKLSKSHEIKNCIPWKFVGQESHDDPANCEDDDKDGTGEDEVLDALPVVQPLTDVFAGTAGVDRGWTSSNKI